MVFEITKRFRGALISFTLALALFFWGVAFAEEGGTKSPLVNVIQIIPDAKLDIRYATENNFLKKKLYPAAACLLREPVAKRLKAASDELRKQGYGLILFDCYRPLSVQREMWKAMPKPGLVAPPSTGSNHNRGAAVDLSIYDLKTGKPLPMPSEFDEFTERAHHSYDKCSPEEAKNRRILRDAMRKAGFYTIRKEWWHYNAPQAKQYELLDLPITATPLSEKR